VAKGFSTNVKPYAENIISNMRDTFRNGDIPYPAGTLTSTAWPDMTTLSVRASFSRAYVFPSDPMGLMNSG
ncbi:hypothetical protein O1420_23065, partial [Bacteroides fragilis]